MTAGSDLDPVIHAPARLRLVATLSALGDGDRLSFPRLQKLLDMTGGNLSTHLRRLEDAGYVTVTKTHEGRTPATYVALTRPGRRAFEDYSAALRALLDPTGATPVSTTPASTTNPTPATDGPAVTPPRAERSTS
ncbi:MAG: transcriptional regulator [Geodermatophilaceae bacterium]